MIDLNPLEILNKRKLEYIAPHFTKTTVQDFSFVDNEIEDWIRTKLKGRYFYTKSLGIENSSKLKNVTAVGFEDHSEMTYFLLACPFIRRNI